ncbi:TIGR02281 family clan AA aspartic protease [uncultured Planktomarina sp.]|jgi:aspartyl protease family protein|uniref:retropepsin-like aspartic protease family protein n=1 Tax=uncultured Planktomarina sp. TaxID=1538529 RepID=UPI003261B8B9
MGDTLARFGYLTILLVAVVGWFMATNRPSIGRSLQMALVWGMIFMGGMVIYGMWHDISRSYAIQVSSDGGAITLPRARDGHYYVTAEINGVDINFLVDTGASDLTLSRADAQRVGIDVDALHFLGSANTANGTVPIAYTRLNQVRLGPHLDRDVSASVNGGKMKKSLLGMSYLGKYGRIEILGDRLVLNR